MMRYNNFKFFSQTALVFGFVLFFSTTKAANRHWVGGTGTWDAASTTNWSASSGGANGASVPTSADDVFFDASSGLTGATVTIGATANCLSFTWSATTGTWAIGSSINIYGNMTLNASMTISGSSSIYFKSTSAGRTITTAGKTIPGTVYFDGVGGVWTFQDAFTSSAVLYFEVDNGTVNTNNYNLTLSGLADLKVAGGTLNLGSSIVSVASYAITVSSGTLNCGSATITNTGSSGGLLVSGGTVNLSTSTLSTRCISVTSGSIDFGSATISITGGSTSTVSTRELSIASGATVTTGTPSITFTGASNSNTAPIEVYLGTKTIYNLTFSTGIPQILFYDGGSVNNLTFATNSYVVFESAKTFTIAGIVSTTSTCTNYTLFYSSTPTSASTINLSATQTAMTGIQVRDITNSGTNTTCTNCVNAGTNSGFTFVTAKGGQTLYWITQAGGNWNDGNNWSTSSGGAAYGCSPTITDNVVFDALSIIAASKTVTINQRTTASNLNFTSLGAWGLAISNASNYDILLAGNTTLSSNLGTITNSLGNVHLIGLASQKYTSAGKVLTGGITYFNNNATTNLEDNGYFGTVYISTSATLDHRNNAGAISYDLYVNKDWYKLGTYTNRSKTVNFNSSNNSTIYNNTTFYNIIVNKGSSSNYLRPGSSVTVTISNDITVSAGYYYMLYSNSTTAITGNLTVSSANTKYEQFSGTTTITGTVTLDNATATLPLSGGTFTWNNNSTSGFALNTGTMTVSGATVNIGTTNTHTTSVLNVGNSSGTGDATLTVSSGTLNIADKLYVQSDGILNVSGGTINIKATTNNIGTATSKWAIDASGEFKQSGGTINVLGAYNTTSTYPAISFNTTATTTAGNITAGTIILKSTTTGVTSGYYVNWGGKTIFNLQTSVGSGTPTYTQLTNALVVKGSVTINASTTYAAGGLAMSIATDWTNNGTFTPGTNTVTFNGTSTLTTGGNGAGKAFYNVILNGTSATLAGNIDVNNAITLTSGTWDVSVSNYSMNIGGNWTNNATFTPQSGTVTFDGTSSITTGGTGAGKIFYDVASSGTSTLAGNIDIDNDFTLSGGAWDVSGSNYSMNIAGDFVNTSGTFTGQSGTVTFDGAATQSVNVTSAGGGIARNADITFYNIVIDGSDVNMYYDEGNARTINVNNYTINSSKQCSITGI